MFFYSDGERESCMNRIFNHAKINNENLNSWCFHKWLRYTLRVAINRHFLRRKLYWPKDKYWTIWRASVPNCLCNNILLVLTWQTAFPTTFSLVGQRGLHSPLSPTTVTNTSRGVVRLSSLWTTLKPKTTSRNVYILHPCFPYFYLHNLGHTRKSATKEEHGLVIWDYVQPIMMH